MLSNSSLPLQGKESYQSSHFPTTNFDVAFLFEWGSFHKKLLGNLSSTCLFPSWRSTFRTDHLINHPKKLTKNCQEMPCFLLRNDFFFTQKNMRILGGDIRRNDEECGYSLQRTDLHQLPLSLPGPQTTFSGNCRFSRKKPRFVFRGSLWQRTNLGAFLLRVHPKIGDQRPKADQDRYLRVDHGDCKQVTSWEVSPGKTVFETSPKQPTF